MFCKGQPRFYISSDIAICTSALYKFHYFVVPKTSHSSMFTHNISRDSHIRFFSLIAAGVRNETQVRTISVKKTALPKTLLIGRIFSQSTHVLIRRYPRLQSIPDRCNWRLLISKTSTVASATRHTDVKVSRGLLK